MAAEISPEQQAITEELARFSSGDFDRAYMDLNIVAYVKATRAEIRLGYLGPLRSTKTLVSGYSQRLASGQTLPGTDGAAGAKPERSPSDRAGAGAATGVQRAGCSPTSNIRRWLRAFSERLHDEASSGNHAASVYSPGA